MDEMKVEIKTEPIEDGHNVGNTNTGVNLNENSNDSGSSNVLMPTAVIKQEPDDETSEEATEEADINPKVILEDFKKEDTSEEINNENPCEPSELNLVEPKPEPGEIIEEDLENGAENSPGMLCISSPKEEMDDEDSRNLFEEGNIFDKVSNECTEDDQHEDKNDEHNLSDDFKIGLESESIEEEEDIVYEEPNFEEVDSNIYLIDKKKSRQSKEVRRMQCECPFEPDDPAFIGCDETCLNRLLMIECNNRCPTGEFCTNKNFQRGCQYNLEIFKAGRKGWGLKTKEFISKGAFIIEYCGEVVDYKEFHYRTQNYAKEGIHHYYFMTLKTNEIVDATKKGCKSRFINHSCDPNCVTQKWTVNGFLRVGFFALRHISPEEELSFDYQFQRYGEKPQMCYCGSSSCRGVIGIEQNNAVPSYIEKIFTGSPSSSSKKKVRKEQFKEFYGSELADELNELLGSKWELRNAEQTLELIRLMVKIETLHERQELLKILQTTSDSSALKAFVRYKGLSLLWSWMVDAPEEKMKYKREILKTLKHIPIPNKNELDDSKLLNVIMKWATPPSPLNNKVILSDDDTQSSDGDLKIDEGGSTSQDESAKEDNGEDSDKKKRVQSDDVIEITDDDVNTETDIDFDRGESQDESMPSKKAKKKTKKKKDSDKRNERREEIAFLSASLIEDWKALKEVFRIPKKSQTPDKRFRENNADNSSPTVPEKKSNGTVQSKPEKYTKPDRSRKPEKTIKADKSVLPDSTFLTPEEKHKQIEIHKGIGAFLGYAKELSTKSYPEIPPLMSDIGNSNRSNRKSRRRSWRKSPDRRIGIPDTTEREVDIQHYDYRARIERDRRLSLEEKGNWKNKNKNNKIKNNSHDDNNIDNINEHWDDWSNENQTPYQQQQNQLPQHPPQPQNFPPQQSSPFNNDSNSSIRPLLSTTPQFPRLNQPSQPSMLQPLPPIPPHGMTPPIPPPVFPQMSGAMPTQPPLVPPPMPNPVYNPVPVPANSSQSTSYNPTNSQQFKNSPNMQQPNVSTLNVVNQLQLLLSAERLKNASQNNSNSNTPDNRSSTNASPRPSSPSPNRTKSLASLAPHWKTATDADGRMYYYHAITRETSWDPPPPAPVKVEPEEDANKYSKKRHTSDTPTASPPIKQSPRIVAADTTHHPGPRTPPSSSTVSSSKTAEVAARTQKIKDTFKSKVSSVVVNCLNVYQKVECKQGRIKTPDDFKFLARKLTHGLVQKEIQRIKSEELLNCNDSVKMKIKEYIRNYMKKFGQYYVRS